MIHHLSIPARDPRHVAEVLVRLFDGELSRFGPYRDSWIAWAPDGHGTAVEVYPVGTQMVPAATDTQAQFRHDPQASPYVATHAAISVARGEAEILAVAAEVGWRALRLSRGPFDVIEFWVENSVMLELLTPAMAADYLASVPGWKP
jgi:hypothetical protein